MQVSSSLSEPRWTCTRGDMVLMRVVLCCDTGLTVVLYCTVLYCAVRSLPLRTTRSIYVTLRLPCMLNCIRYPSLGHGGQWLQQGGMPHQPAIYHSGHGWHGTLRQHPSSKLVLIRSSICSYMCMLTLVLSYLCWHALHRSACVRSQCV